MLRGLEGNQRSIQPLRLPVGLRIAPSANVSGDSINELMVPKILRRLVWITAVHAGGPN